MKMIYMTKITAICTMFLLVLSCNNSYAQNVDGFFHVGDTLRLTVDQVQNHWEPTMQVPVTGKKLTLIEIWGVGCKACIEAMPRHQQMQQKYNNDIQIILLCADSLARLNKAKERIDNIRNVRLPIITAESGLHKKFQFRQYGTFIWVDSVGVIQYITNGTYKDRGSIEKFIAGEELSFSEKTELKLDTRKPVKENIAEYLEDNEVLSFFMAKKDPKYHFAGTIARKTDKETGNIVRIYSYDTDIIKLYKHIYKRPLLHKTLVKMEVSAPDRIMPDYPSVGDNRFVFDLNVRNDISSDKTMQYLEEQLKWLYNIRGTLVKRDVKCLVLKRIDKVDLASKTTESINKLDMNYMLQVRNLPWWNFMTGLTSGSYAVELPPLPIVDETGISKDLKVDLSFQLRYDNLDLMNQSLAPLGLRFEEAIRELEVLLIEDYI